MNDENSIRAMRALEPHEVVELRTGDGDVDAFEILMTEERFKVATNDIKAFLREHLGSGRCVSRDMGSEGTLFFFSDPYTAFQFRIFVC
jgi:hypothetical protein